MIQSIARVLLGVFLLAGIALALSRHGKTIPAYRFHAGIYASGIAAEALLIWLAGGWG